MGSEACHATVLERFWRRSTDYCKCTASALALEFQYERILRANRGLPRMITLENRASFDLDRYFRVAWQGEHVQLAPAAVDNIAKCRQSFLKLIDEDDDIVVYGVTSGYGQNAYQRFSREERVTHARKVSYATSVAFGQPLPTRVTRGFVFARLANFIEGHAVVSPELAQIVATMLNQGELPEVPSRGMGCAGEIQPLGHLFSHIAKERDMGEKESLSLVNGSPCASALAADVLLSGRRRLVLAYQIFALSLEALRAPLGAYDSALESLWHADAEQEAVRKLRSLTAGGGDERRSYQAPVSWRIAPRVLARAERVLSQLQQVAEDALGSVTDNPVYIPPDETHPLGRVFSTGGYHNGLAYPAIDDVSASFADLATLCDRQITKLLDGRVSHLPNQLLAADDGYIGVAGMAAVGYAEEARHAAARSFLPGSEGGGFGQNDVGVPTFWAFNNYTRTCQAFDALLAYLGVTASQAFYVTDRKAPPALEDCLSTIRAYVSPVTESRALGPEVEQLARCFSERAVTA